MARISKRERLEAVRRQKRQQRIVWGIGAVGVLLLIGGAIASLTSRPRLVVDPSDAEMVALGQQLYQAQCSSCHGENLEGEPNWSDPSPDGVLKAPPHDETGHTWHHDDATLIEAIKLGGARLPASAGVSPMPAYENVLTDEEIGAVLSYIKSTWPPNILDAQARR